MITSAKTTSGNRHIQSLQHLFESSQRPVKWLVIAHDDPQMIDALSSALSGESAAILQAAQDTWDFAENELPETIEWALQQGELENIVLVGHSHPTGSAVSASLVTPAPDNDRDTADEKNTSRLLAGVRRSSAQSQQARKMFARKIQQLSEVPVVHNRWSSDELAIYGLLYQSDSGVFLAYDIQQESFRPLIA